MNDQHVSIGTITLKRTGGQLEYDVCGNCGRIYLGPKQIPCDGGSDQKVEALLAILTKCKTLGQAKVTAAAALVPRPSEKLRPEGGR